MTRSNRWVQLAIVYRIIINEAWNVVLRLHFVNLCHYALVFYSCSICLYMYIYFNLLAKFATLNKQSRDSENAFSFWNHMTSINSFLCFFPFYFFQFKFHFERFDHISMNEKKIQIVVQSSATKPFANKWKKKCVRIDFQLTTHSEYVCNLIFAFN